MGAELVCKVHLRQGIFSDQISKYTPKNAAKDEFNVEIYDLQMKGG